jgi:hypothetical protein
MKRKISGWIAAGLLVGSTAVHAAPVAYLMSFTPTIGTSGVGTFSWDAALGVITDFSWNFGDGAFVGGMENSYGMQDTLGGTRGQFVFEMLSEEDVSPSFDCTNECLTQGFVITGAAPGDAIQFSLNGIDSPGGARYSFRDDLGSLLARGLVTIAPQNAVPEPGALGLVGIGLAACGFARRRKPA